MKRLTREDLPTLRALLNSIGDGGMGPDQEEQEILDAAFRMVEETVRQQEASGPNGRSNDREGENG